MRAGVYARKYEDDESKRYKPFAMVFNGFQCLLFVCIYSVETDNFQAIKFAKDLARSENGLRFALIYNGIRLIQHAGELAIQNIAKQHTAFSKC